MLAAAVGGSVAACAAAVPPPRCRSLCCRLMASALFGMRAAPSRRNGGPRPSSALPLNRARRPRFADGGVRWGQKPARPLRGSAAPPYARWPPSSGASGGGVVSRQPPLSSSRSGGASAQPPSPPPSPPASLCAGNQGRGACSGGQRPPRRWERRALCSRPAPRGGRLGRGVFCLPARRGFWRRGLVFSPSGSARREISGAKPRPSPAALPLGSPCQSVLMGQLRCAPCGGCDRCAVGLDAIRCALAFPHVDASLSASAYSIVTSGRSCCKARCTLARS